MSENWCLHLTILVLLTPFIFGFNVDHVNYVRYEGQVDSMFGFSVALHKEANRSWVIIGAPEADSSSLQRTVRNGGLVYRCEASDDNRCQIIPFDRNGNAYNDRSEQIDTKSYQWFGATVASAGVDGPLVACAPRYVFHTMVPRKVERIEPVGTCHLAKDNFQVFKEYSPCRTSYWGYHRQGSCQAGLSAAISKDGERLYIGAPGSWYWQGQVYSISTDAQYPYKPAFYYHFGDKQNTGQEYSYDLNDARQKVYATGESTLLEDDSYLGYSSITGDFNGDGRQGVAVGMPRGGGLLGKVLIFSWNMINQDNITGEQIGAYFGYSLCSVDVDGDHLDDLIIGAPMHTTPNNEGKYEMGRIYIMYQGRQNKFKELESVDGKNSRGRFGLALTSLGDINLDGYGDYAVGAPYDGSYGNGAVYIYHGAPPGIPQKHSQVIFAEDVVGTPGLRTFGFAIAGGIDLDGNLYPDLVVGAYESNKVVSFRSRPIAIVNASTFFEIDKKLISLDEKLCRMKYDLQPVTCTKIKSCLEYSGINLPLTIDLEVSWVLDAKKTKTPRMFFLLDEGKNMRNITMRLRRGKKECRTEDVYIIDNIRDKLTPLEVEMRYQMRSNTAPISRKKREALEPVIDQKRELIQRDSINIQKACGEDNVCEPDLRLEIETVDKYLLGSRAHLNIEVRISNRGEDAYEAGFYMTMPHDLDFIKVERIGTNSVPTCNAPSLETNNVLKCDLGNPLPEHDFRKFKVVMIPSEKIGMAPSYEFYMEVNSTNPDKNGSSIDNVIKKSINIWMEHDLSVKGSTTSDYAHYNSSKYEAVENATNENDVGPHVVHMYNIRNNGTSKIVEAEIFILWPSETFEGDTLIYLLDQPIVSGNVRCELTGFANMRNLVLDKLLSQKKYLEIAGAVAAESGAQVGATAGVKTEHSYKNTFETSTSRNFTEEEKRRLDEEQLHESTGDGSHLHAQRAKAAAAAAAAAAVGGGSFAATHQSGSFGSRHGSGSYGATQGSGSYGAAQGSGSYGAAQGSGSYGAAQGSGSHGAAQGSGSFGAQSGAGQTGHFEWTNSNQQIGNPNSVTKFYEKKVMYDEHGNVINVQESSTEHYGNLHGSRDFGVHNMTFGNSQGGSQGSGISQGHVVQAGIGGGQWRGSAQGSAGSQSSMHTHGSSSGGVSHRTQSGSTGAHQSNIHHGGVSSQVSQGTYGGKSSHQASGSSQSGDQFSHHQGSIVSQGAGGGSQSFQGSQNAGSINQGISGQGAWQSSQSQESGTTSGRRRMMSQQDGEEARPDLITGVGGLAQGGRGFQVGTFDLGINRGNVDDEVRRQSSSSHLSSGGNAHNAQSGSFSSHSSSGHSGNYKSSSGGTSYSSSMNHGRGAVRTENTQSDDHEPLYYDDGSEDQRNNRLKREAEYDSDAELNKLLDCKSGNCSLITCTAGPLAKDEDVWIAIRFRVSAVTLKKLASNVALNVSTMAIARVAKLPYIGEPKEKPLKTHEIIFTAIPEPLTKVDVVPLWVVVLSACAGTLILLLLVFLLYKCGFFNRNRPSDSSERQPLNRNNGYHGDEHL